MTTSVLMMILSIPAIIIAMAFHEFSHAFVAVKLGDDTPIITGRYTLDPFKHIDLLGFIMLLLVHFGWAKPVMINPERFKHPKLGDVLVSIAGPVSNLILAILGALGIKLLLVLTGGFSGGTEFTTLVGVELFLIVLYNISFAIFNILPFPPMDGSRIVYHAIPDRYKVFKEKYFLYGSWAFLALIVISSIVGMVNGFSLLGLLINTPINQTLNLILVKIMNINPSDLQVLVDIFSEK